MYVATNVYPLNKLGAYLLVKCRGKAMTDGKHNTEILQTTSATVSSDGKVDHELLNNCIRSTNGTVVNK